MDNSMIGNREIKFRAWLPKIEVGDQEFMTEVHFIDFMDGTVFCSDKNGGYETNINDCVLMQYTGLKDKNGKEIYEGDIVKMVRLERTYALSGKQCSKGYTKEGVVEYKQTFCAFGLANEKYLGGWELIDTVQFDEFEVIGNIFENPELLK